MDGPLILPESVILPVEPIELELAKAILPLRVAGVALLLYKALPLIPVEFRVKLLELVYPFRSRAEPEFTVTPFATPLSVPTNFNMLLASTVIDPADPDTMLGKEVVTELALELATLMTIEPSSVTVPEPKVPVPDALPI